MTNNYIKREKSSYRDFKATVYKSKDKIFRKINTKLNIDFEKFLVSDYYKKNLNKIINTKVLNDLEVYDYGLEKEKGVIWLEHKKLEDIVYPYELTFGQLKDSAILFLDLYIDAIKNSYDIVDASAYNIQFDNKFPVFIDIASFTFLDKESNIGWHKQFCENYLAPLLIKSKANINFNEFFISNIDGLDLKITSKLLPISTYFNFNILANIHLHSYLNSKISSTSKKNSGNKKVISISLKQRILIANSFKKIIDNLDTKNQSYWSLYSKKNSYTEESYNNKKKTIIDFIKKEKPRSILDLGCNDGDYSEICFQNGVKKIVGVDNDADSLNRSYYRFKKTENNFLPIFQNFSNPSPNIGWNNEERESFQKRYQNKFDGIICLAFMHHICIGKNVPIKLFLEYLEKFSKNILIEFVHKDDEMVKNLSINKKDIIKDYTIENFKKILLTKNYTIVNQTEISKTRTILHAING